MRDNFMDLDYLRRLQVQLIYPQVMEISALIGWENRLAHKQCECYAE
jgi:hypothetical protein